MKKNSVIIAVVALALGLIGGAVAYASIPGPDGTIHGCYKTSNPAQGALLAIDSAASCPSGYTALNWNQTGPQGSAGANGVSGYEVVHQQVMMTGYEPSTFQLDCPTGKQPLSGGYKLNPDQTGGLGDVLSSYPSGSSWVFVLTAGGSTLFPDLYVTCASVV